VAIRKGGKQREVDVAGLGDGQGLSHGETRFEGSAMEGNDGVE
jgi:hypothetical protein